MIWMNTCSIAATQCSFLGVGNGGDPATLQTFALAPFAGANDSLTDFRSTVTAPPVGASVAKSQFLLIDSSQV
jgi:hypothetical protein